MGKTIRPRLPASADELLDALVRDHPVSRRFAGAARPLLERLYAEVPQARQPDCIAVVREIFARQAETEQTLQRAAEELGLVLERLPP